MFESVSPSARSLYNSVFKHGWQRMGKQFEKLVNNNAVVFQNNQFYQPSQSTSRCQLFGLLFVLPPLCCWHLLYSSYTNTNDHFTTQFRCIWFQNISYTKHQNYFALAHTRRGRLLKINNFHLFLCCCCCCCY